MKGLLKRLQELQIEIQEDLNLLEKYSTTSMFKLTESFLKEFLEKATAYKIEFNSDKFLDVYDDLNDQFCGMLIADTEDILEGTKDIKREEDFGYKIEKKYTEEERDRLLIKYKATDSRRKIL